MNLFQYTGTHQEIWINGRLICSRRAEPYKGNTGATVIGKNPGWTNIRANNFQGYMRALQIYGRALTLDEVAKLNVMPTGIELANNAQGSSSPNATQIKNTVATTVAIVPTQPFLSIEGSTLTINGSPGEIYILEATANFHHSGNYLPH